MNPFDVFFAEVFATNEPLVVVVGEDTWKIDSENPDTPRNMWIAHLLMMVGGISVSVTPGIYHVNMKPMWFNIQLSIEPVVKL